MKRFFRRIIMISKNQTLANLNLDGNWKNRLMGDSFAISGREGKSTYDNGDFGTRIGDVVLTIAQTSECVFKGRYKERYGSWLDIVGWISPRGDLTVSQVKDPEEILNSVAKGDLFLCQKTPVQGITKEGDVYLRTLENSKRVDLFQRK